MQALSISSAESLLSRSRTRREKRAKSACQGNWQAHYPDFEKERAVAAEFGLKAGHGTKDDSLQSEGHPAPRSAKPPSIKPAPSDASIRSIPIRQPKEKPKAAGRCITTLGGRGGCFLGVSCTPDGRLASASMDGTVRLWDALLNKSTVTLEGHADWARAVAWSPEGRLASASNDGKVRLWHVETGACIAILEGHGGSVLALAWGPDGQLASGSSDGTIRIWDSAGTCIAKLGGHIKPVSAVAWAPDGRLASASFDATVRIWNVHGVCVEVLQGDAYPVSATAWALDGRLASAHGNGMIRIWDLAGTRTVCTATLEGPADWINAVSWAPDGRLASAADDYSVWLWKSDGTSLGKFEGHSDQVNAVAWHPDGWLVSASDDGTIRFWSSATVPMEIPAASNSPPAAKIRRSTDAGELLDHPDAPRPTQPIPAGERISQSLLLPGREKSGTVYDRGSRDYSEAATHAASGPPSHDTLQEQVANFLELPHELPDEIPGACSNTLEPQKAAPALAPIQSVLEPTPKINYGGCDINAETPGLRVSADGLASDSMDSARKTIVKQHVNGDSVDEEGVGTRTANAPLAGISQDAVPEAPSNEPSTLNLTQCLDTLNDFTECVENRPQSHLASWKPDMTQHTTERAAQIDEDESIATQPLSDIGENSTLRQYHVEYSNSSSVGSELLERAPKLLQETMRTNYRPVQNGLARIRIEILSLYQRNRRDSIENTSSEIVEYDEDNDIHVDGGDDFGSTGSSPANGISQATSSPQSIPSTSSQRPNRNQADEDDDADRGNNGRRKRPCKDLGPIDATQDLPRFACPYQVVERQQDCLRKGPRNPKGGCDGISRLKQHLSRRHMLSSRCPRCWISIDKKSKLAEHIQNQTCQERPRLDHERFMAAEKEPEVERTGGATAEEAWWALFKLLIPGMAMQNEFSLRVEYQPYYLPPELSFTIPSINFSNVLFSSSEQNLRNGSRQATSDPFINSLESEAAAMMDSTSSGSFSSLSQTFNVPIYETPPSRSLETPYHVPVCSQGPLGRSTAPPSMMASSSIESCLDSDAFSGRLSSTLTTTTQSDSALSTSGSAIGNLQLGRNYERLQEKKRRADDVIKSLQDTNRAIQADVSRVDKILEDIFALEHVPEPIFEKLSQISNILVAISERQR